MGDELSAMQRKFDRGAALVRATAPARREQQEQIARVSHRIQGSILAFFRTKAPGTEFYANDLRVHVAGDCGLVAPDSARRIAASMKPYQVNYELVNRSLSLFRVLAPEPRPQEGD